MRSKENIFFSERIQMQKIIIPILILNSDHPSRKIIPHTQIIGYHVAVPQE